MSSLKDTLSHPKACYHHKGHPRGHFGCVFHNAQSLRAKEKGFTTWLTLWNCHGFTRFVHKNFLVRFWKDSLVRFMYVLWSCCSKCLILLQLGLHLRGLKAECVPFRNLKTPWVSICDTEGGMTNCQLSVYLPLVHLSWHICRIFFLSAPFISFYTHTHTQTHTHTHTTSTHKIRIKKRKQLLKVSTLSRADLASVHSSRSV